MDGDVVAQEKAAILRSEGLVSEIGEEEGAGDGEASYRGLVKGSVEIGKHDVAAPQGLAGGFFDLWTEGSGLLSLSAFGGVAAGEGKHRAEAPPPREERGSLGFILGAVLSEAGDVWPGKRLAGKAEVKHH